MEDSMSIEEDDTAEYTTPLPDYLIIESIVRLFDHDWNALHTMMKIPALAPVHTSKREKQKKRERERENKKDSEGSEPCALFFFHSR